MNLFIFSNDNFLIEYIKKEFCDRFDFFYNSDISKAKYNDIIIVDNCDKNIYYEDYSKNLNIINIGKVKVDCCININIPLRIIDLKNKIIGLIDNINKNIINKNNVFLDKSKNIVVINNIATQFTQKEFDLLLFLYENKESTKSKILLNVWKSINIDNKTLETTIYNIKQKINNDNFILCNNGLYSIMGD